MGSAPRGSPPVGVSGLKRLTDGADLFIPSRPGNGLKLVVHPPGLSR